MVILVFQNIQDEKASDLRKSGLFGTTFQMLRKDFFLWGCLSSVLYSLASQPKVVPSWQLSSKSEWPYLCFKEGVNITEWSQIILVNELESGQKSQAFEFPICTYFSSLLISCPSWNGGCFVDGSAVIKPPDCRQVSMRRMGWIFWVQNFCLMMLSGL